MAFDTTTTSGSSSGSFFQKTVILHDWWLTKSPETLYHDDNDNTLVIGVAGLTFIPQQNRGERCFYSAPILKAQDYVELETVDGVFVILKGFINQQRTLENGFSPQVFNDFVFGFPLNWKKFATSCPERSAAKCVARDGKDSIKGHADFHDRSPSKSQQRDIYTVDMEVQDCEDTILNNKTTTVCNAYSYETPQAQSVLKRQKVLGLEALSTGPISSLKHEHVVKAGHEVPCERSPVTSEFEADSSLRASPIVRKAADLSTAFKRLRVSSRRMTRSMTKVDISKRDLRPTHYKSGCSDPFTNTSVGVGSLVNASTEDFNFASSVIAEIDDAVPLRTNMKACRNKEKGQEGVASKDEIGSKKVITRSKSISKLKSANSRRWSPKKQLITSLKTRSLAKKASKETCGSEYILSPESFSGKKSRSGRVLLPRLEFWRNQRVLYDQDGEVCGVEEHV